MPKTADFVLQIDGVQEFREFIWAEDRHPPGTEPYYEARERRSGPSVMFLAGTSVKASQFNGDLGPVRSAIIASMKRAAGGDLKNVGTVCLFGSSNGCAAILSLAAALEAQNVKINFICLADLPMFAGGRSPEVQDIGPNRPTNDPNVSLGVKASRFVFGPLGLVPVPRPGMAIKAAAHNDVPKVTLQTKLKAVVRENYYQTKGNRIKARITSLNTTWRWTSDMAGGEVHGEIDGWKNEKITNLTIKDPTLAPLLFEADDEFHNALDDHILNNIWYKRWPVELAKL